MAIRRRCSKCLYTTTTTGIHRNLLIVMRSCHNLCRCCGFRELLDLAIASRSRLFYDKWRWQTHKPAKQALLCRLGISADLTGATERSTQIQQLHQECHKELVENGFLIKDWI